jgi:hypothetical protein
MHDALAVAEVEGLKEFENVVSHIVILEFGVQAPEIGVVDIFEYQRGRFALYCDASALLSGTRQ